MVTSLGDGHVDERNFVIPVKPPIRLHELIIWQDKDFCGN